MFQTLHEISKNQKKNNNSQLLGCEYFFKSTEGEVREIHILRGAEPSIAEGGDMENIKRNAGSI